MPMHSTTFCGNKRAYSSGQTQQHDCETKRIHKAIAWVPRQLECRMFRTFLPSNWYQQKTQAHQEGLTTQHGFLPWPKQRHCARTNGAIEQKKLGTPLPPPKNLTFFYTVLQLRDFHVRRRDRGIKYSNLCALQRICRVLDADSAGCSSCVYMCR